jgi:hypothetical protein
MEVTYILIFQLLVLLSIPLYGSFFIERQSVVILFTNRNVCGFMKDGMKLLNMETLISKKATWEISMTLWTFLLQSCLCRV